jgi:hypothetical protein
MIRIPACRHRRAHRRGGGAGLPQPDQVHARLHARRERRHHRELLGNETKGSANRSSRPSPASPVARRRGRGAQRSYAGTLLVAPSAPAHGALSKNVKWKVVDDFTWISTASFYPFLICVRADSRFQTLKQLLDEARANPGSLKYGSAGVGSILHTTVELMGNMTRTKFLHVPYRGEAPAITGLLTGDFDFIAATSGPISSRVRSGEFRALAVTSARAGATSRTFRRSRGGHRASGDLRPASPSGQPAKTGR